jgi:hypothetical protein
MNKYEQLVEFIINDETDKARELFHNIVVEKSRDIYESLIDEADLSEVGGNEVEDLVDEVSLDEQGISEEEDEMDMMSMDSDEEMDFDDSGDLDSHEEEHGDVEDRVQDLEAALDELKAEFDALMAGEEAEEEQMPGIHGDDMGDEDDMNMMEAEECDESEEDEEELDETIVREYVEKVSAPSNTEGADNKTSIVAKKNDMGGTAANIVKGGTAQGGNVKKPQEINSGNINVPGGKAGNAFAKKESAKTKEEGGVAKQSPLAK